MEKRIRRRIGALVVVGMFVAMLYLPGVIAPDGETVLQVDGSYRINIDNDGDEDDRIFSVSHDDNDTELFRIQENGYVGIGTTNPDERLHIDAASELQIVHLENNNGHYYINGESLRNRIISRDSSDTGYKDLQLSTGSSASGLGIYLETSGNVGIGTTSPGFNFEVESSGAASGTEYLLGGFDNSVNGGGVFLGYLGDGTDASEARVRSGGGGGGINLALGTSAHLQAIYILNSNGNVGIGTTSPVTTLDVDGGFATNIVTIDHTDDPYTPATSDYTILVDAASATQDLDINLQAASGREGQILVIKRIDNTTCGHDVVINRAGSDLIDGSTSKTLDTQWESITIQSDGSNWYILASQP